MFRAARSGFAIVLLLGGVTTLLWIAGWLPAGSLGVDELAGHLRPAAWAGGAVSTALGLVLVAWPRRRPPRETWFRLTQSRASDSDVLFAHGAARRLAAHAAEKIDGVYECDPHLVLSDKGWSIDARLWVQLGAPIPALAAEVRKSLQAQLEHTTGRPVAGVRIRSSYDPPGTARARRLR